jgi:hypothetical protein
MLRRSRNWDIGGPLVAYRFTALGHTIPSHPATTGSSPPAAPRSSPTKLAACIRTKTTRSGVGSIKGAARRLGKQVDVRNRRVTVFGKGSKERTIPYSPRTGQASWRALLGAAVRRTGSQLYSPFLISSNTINRSIRTRILSLLRRSGYNKL